jgi:molybdenum cofactor cytidylyltransferase
MFFGEVPLDAAEGAILAHSEAVPTGRLRKGLVLGGAEIALLQAAGLTRVTVARLEPGTWRRRRRRGWRRRWCPILRRPRIEAGEAFTGRVNLNAIGPGMVELDVPAIHG